MKLNILVILLTLLVATEALGFGNDQEFKPKNNLILNPGGQVDFSAAADLQGNSILNAVFDSDLNTLTNIVNADVKSTAAIDRTKIASGTANYVLINNGSGVFSEEQFLNKTRGGTGITSTATFPASGTISVIDATEDLSNKTFTDSITLTEIASPGTPAASDKFFFCKADDKCYFKNDAATEVEISTGAHSGGGPSILGTYAFHVRLNTTRNITATGDQLITFDSEQKDLGGAFDTGNYWFKPLVAGEYLIYLHVLADNVTATDDMRASIGINGSPGSFEDWLSNLQSTTTSQSGSVVGIFTLNGSTDYIQAYINAPTDINYDLPANGARMYMVGYRLSVY